MHTCPNCLAEMPDEIVAPIPMDEEVYEYTEDEIPFCTLRPIALPGERSSMNQWPSEKKKQACSSSSIDLSCGTVF